MNDKLKEILDEFIEETKKDCYKIELLDEEPSILDNKIGGLPYIPQGEEYPTDIEGNPLALLLQVNLKDIELDNYPTSGYLEIFTDKNLNYPCKYKVRYFESDKEYKKDLPIVDLKHYLVKKTYKIKLKKSISYLPVSDYRFYLQMNMLLSWYVKDYSLDDINSYLYELDSNWLDKYNLLTDNDSITIGGYPDFRGNDPRINRNDDKDECLFKIDSNYDNDKVFIGKNGVLNAFINEYDLQEKLFENTLVDWESL